MSSNLGELGGPKRVSMCGPGHVVRFCPLSRTAKYSVQHIYINLVVFVIHYPTSNLCETPPIKQGGTLYLVRAAGCMARGAQAPTNPFGIYASTVKQQEHVRHRDSTLSPQNMA